MLKCNVQESSNRELHGADSATPGGPKPDYLLWIDYVRTAGIFMVIYLHSAAPWTFDYDKVPAAAWTVGNLSSSATRACVPLFFMISGALLLNHREERLSDFARKRLSRVAVPLATWSLIYLAFASWRGDLTTSIGQALLTVPLAPVYFHLWFLYAILGIYLTVPLLRASLRAWNSDLVRYFLAVWFLASSLLPMLARWTDASSPYDLHWFLGYTGYFVLGDQLARRRYTRRETLLGSVLFLAMVALTAWATAWKTQRQGSFYDCFYDYSSPNIILMSVAALVTIKGIVDNFAWPHSTGMRLGAKLLGDASFGIYLAHAAILDLLRRGIGSWKWAFLDGDPALAIPVTALLTLVISVALVSPARRYRTLRFMIP